MLDAGQSPPRTLALSMAHMVKVVHLPRWRVVRTLGVWTAFVSAALTAHGGAAPTARKATAMQLTSSAFTEGGTIPVRFTCDGEDRPPPLRWTDPPPGTQGFALIVDDPDAPRGTWHHWALFNIPGAAREAVDGKLAPAATAPDEARNDFGDVGYGGPCPPRSDPPHRYRFRLFALNVAQLRLRSDPRAADVEQAIRPHVRGEAQLTGHYQRR